MPKSPQGRIPEKSEFKLAAAALAHIQPKLSMDCNLLPLSIPKKIAATSKFRDMNQRPNSALFQ